MKARRRRGEAGCNVLMFEVYLAQLCVWDCRWGGKGLADHPGQPLPDYIADRKFRKKKRKGDVNFSVSSFRFFCNWMISTFTKGIHNSENAPKRKTQSERAKQEYGGQLLLHIWSFCEGLFVTSKEECWVLRLNDENSCWDSEHGASWE